jgi:hypothetical protein
MKSDKHLGKVKGQHKPDIDPSKLTNQPKGPKKKRPRYRAQRYFGRSGWSKGFWHDEGFARTQEEATHLAQKARREIRLWGDSVGIRVIDTDDGDKVIWKHGPQP